MSMIAVPGSCTALIASGASRVPGTMSARTLCSKVGETSRAIVGGIVSWIACWVSKPTLWEIGSTETTALVR
jgi:hypothetical protein